MSSPANKVRSQLSWLLYLTPLVAIGPISTDLYLPAMPQMATGLSATVAEIQMTLSLFMLGFAFSQLLTGPLSDRFGRRPIILAGMTLYFAASVVCIYAPNVEVLIAARFVQAFGSCTGTVLGRAIIRDVYSPKESLRVMGILGAAMAVAPALAPIIGSWLLEHFGWQSNFVAMAIFAAGLLGATLLAYEETNQYRGQSSITPFGIARNFWSLLQNKTFRGYGGVMSLMFGGLFAFISGAPVVLINDMGMTPKQFGYAFSVMVVGYAVGSILVGQLSKIYSAKIVVGIGVCIVLAASTVMALLAYTGYHNAWAILVPNGVFSLGFGLAVPACMAASIGPFPRLAGSAASLIGFCQGTLGFLSGWVVSKLYDHSPVGLVTTIFGFGLLTFIMYITQARTAHDGISPEEK